MGWRDEVLVEDPLGSEPKTMRVLSSAGEGFGLIVWGGGSELPIRVNGPADGRYIRSENQPSVISRRAMLRDLQEIEARRVGFTEDGSMAEDEVYDALLGMGVGSTRRFGPARVFRSEAGSWLVAAGGVGKEFSNARFAARWVAAFTEE